MAESLWLYKEGEGTTQAQTGVILYTTQTAGRKPIPRGQTDGACRSWTVHLQNCEPKSISFSYKVSLPQELFCSHEKLSNAT